MNISSNKPYTIYRKEYDGKTFFRTGLSKKKQDGTYEKGFIDIKFKKGIDISDRTQIYITNAFLTFYLTKEKKTIPYIQVMDYELVSDVIDKEHKDIQTTSIKLDDIDVNDDDNFELPF